MTVAPVRAGNVHGSVDAIVTDLDGTLLRSDGTVSEATADALAEANRRGLLVVFATARSRDSASRVVSKVAPTAPVICSNGAVVLRPGNALREAWRTQVIPRPVVSQFLAYVRREFPRALVAADTVRARTVDPDWPTGWGSGAPGDRPFWPIDAALPPPAAVICLMVLGAWTDARDVPGLWPVHATSSHDGLIEISARAATKESALRWLCKTCEIPMDRVLAFGDMPNDLGMLEACGTAVAVANAHPAVLDAAAHVTLSNDQDGVAAYLNEMFAADDDATMAPRPRL